MLLSDEPVAPLSGVEPGVVECFFLCFIAPVVVEVSVPLLGAMEVSVPGALGLTAELGGVCVWPVMPAAG